jgi:hypothetical protein
LKTTASGSKSQSEINAGKHTDNALRPMAVLLRRQMFCYGDQLLQSHVNPESRRLDWLSPLP